ncbi:MAG: peptidylprolyl isomerase [Thermoflexales bacterium]|nr:peptidylprolyl isomerase [Thermoflexales bacterium]
MSLVDSHKDTLKVVYRHFPLSFHEHAQITAEASEAAGAQGKFWEMNELLYARQSEWAGKTVDEMPKVLESYAKEIGLDTARFAKELAEGTYKANVEADLQESLEVGLPGTPTFFLDGVHLPSDYLGMLDSLIPWFAWLNSSPMQFSAPDEVIDPAKTYTAIFKLDKGDIVVEMYASQAPNTVNSFVFLARQGYFDGVTFHRVLKDFVAQAGDPSGTGMGSPGYQCNDEIVPGLKFDGPGVVAMANSGENTNGSQFFITYAAAPQLDGGFTIFGRVIAGMDVAQNITARDPDQNPSTPGDAIRTVVIEEK